MPLGRNDHIGTCFKIHTCHCKLIFSLRSNFKSILFPKSVLWKILILSQAHVEGNLIMSPLTFITILSMMYVIKLWSMLHLHHNLPHDMKGDGLIIYDFLLLNFTNLLWKLLIASWTWSVLNIFYWSGSIAW
jgi:hypothetical protein